VLTGWRMSASSSWAPATSGSTVMFVRNVLSDRIHGASRSQPADGARVGTGHARVSRANLAAM
jgi:hypothetical protein